MASLPANLLDLSVDRGARLVARSLLAHARAARRRLGRPNDGEALHDFRVALRRLRSWERAFRPYLGKAIPKRTRRALRQLAAWTNAGRDAEVHLAWMQRVAADALSEHQGGMAWLTGRLEERRDQAYSVAARSVGPAFDRVERQMRPRLGPRAATEVERFGPVTAALLQAYTVGLQGRLSEIGGPMDQAAIHAARIGGKRLRYLLEPLPPHRGQAEPLVQRLRELQDLTGEMHDLHLLDGELARARPPVTARAGVAALRGRASARQAELWGTLRAEWLDASAAEVFARLEALARGLHRFGWATREIEHKFLLTGFPPGLEDAPSVQIRQGWLPGATLHERIRAVAADDGERYYRCVKVGAGLERLELEEETTKDLFDVLWPLTQGKRVSKRRYRRRDSGLEWEVDVFGDRDLVLAEVEVPRVRKRVSLPAWLRPVVVREVTDEPEYVNLNLAR